MGELPDELPQMVAALPAPDLVWPMLLQPAGSLPLGESFSTGSQISEEQINALLAGSNPARSPAVGRSMVSIAPFS